MPDLILRNLSKSFGSTAVLSDVTLECPAGELLVLLGPSGCGKSTLLRLIAGLESPDSGEIYLGDRRVDRLSPRERNVALVFQNYSLYPHMTVAGNLAFPLSVAGWKKDAIRTRVAEVAALLGLSDRLNERPGRLSGGQRQRVALGRAIVREPALFLLDEPLSNLDAELRVKMRREIVRIQRQLRCTTVHVTHDQAEALSMADRIALMRDGQLVQVGTPEQLYREPSCLFAAQFLGQPKMNLIPGRIERHLLVPFGLSMLDRKSGQADREVLIGLRPELVTIRSDGEYVAEVTGCEYLGDHHVATLRFKGAAVAVSHLSQPVEPGQAVNFSFRPQDIVLFDPTGGARLDSE